MLKRFLMCLSDLANREVPVIVSLGESNAGGLGRNDDLGSIARIINPKAVILNNDTLVLEDYYLGVNNQLGHSGISDVPANADTHGIQYTLVDKAQTPPQRPTVLVKAGQGGSTVADWLSTSSTGYWSTLVTRYNEALAQVSARGLTPVVYFVYWLGINDAITPGFNPVTWRTNNDQVLAQIRGLGGATVPILQVKLMDNEPNRGLVNVEIDSTATVLNDYYPVEVAVADPFVTLDTYHWSATGYRLIGENVNAVINSL